MSLTNTAVKRMLKVFTVLDTAKILDDDNGVKGTGEVSWTTPSNDQIKTSPFSISVESGNIKKLELVGKSFKTNVSRVQLSRQTPPNIQYADSYEELFTDKSLFSTANAWGVGFKKYSSTVYPFKLYVIQGITPDKDTLGANSYQEIAVQYNQDSSTITEDSYDFAKKQVQGYGDGYNVIIKVNSAGGTNYWLLTGEAYEYTGGTDNQKSSYNLGDYTSDILNITKLSRFKFLNGVTERLEKLW